MAVAFEGLSEEAPQDGVVDAAPKVRLADVTAYLPAVAAMCLVSVTGGLGVFFVLPMMKEFHTTRSAVLLALSLGGMGYLLVMPIVGRLLTFMKPWVIMAVGACVSAGAFLLYSVAPVLAVAGVAAFLAQAMGAVLCGPITFQTLVVRRTPHLMGRIIGTQATFLAVLGIGLPLVAAPYLTAHGWRATAATASVLVALIVLPIVLIWVRRLNIAADRASDLAEGAPPAPVAHASVPADDGAPPPTSLQILSTPAFWFLLLSIEPSVLTLTALGSNLIPFYADHGVSVIKVSYLLSITSGIGVCGAAVSGFLVDRLGPGRYIMLSSALAATGLAGLALGLASPAIWICMVFASLSGLAPIMGVATSSFFGPKGFAPAAGMIAPFMVTSALGGAGAGWIRDHFGTYQPVFAVLSIAMLLALMAGLMLVRIAKRNKLA